MHSSSRIGLGAVTFGREIDRDASFRILDSDFEKRIRVIDTAEAYGDGASERVIGGLARSWRTAGVVSVQTKVSFAFTPEKIRQAVARSLERLGLDRVEIYYVHKRLQDSPLAPAIALDGIIHVKTNARDGSPAGQRTGRLDSCPVLSKLD